MPIFSIYICLFLDYSVVFHEALYALNTSSHSQCSKCNKTACLRLDTANLILSFQPGGNCSNNEQKCATINTGTPHQRNSVSYCANCCKIMQHNVPTHVDYMYQHRDKCVCRAANITSTVLFKQIIHH